MNLDKIVLIVERPLSRERISITTRSRLMSSENKGITHESFCNHTGRFDCGNRDSLC